MAIKLLTLRLDNEDIPMVLEDVPLVSATESIIVPAFEKDFSKYTVTEFTAFFTLCLLIVMVFFLVTLKRK